MAIKAKNMEKEYGPNKVAGEKFLAANKKKPGVVTLPSGVQYKVIKEGNGPMPKDTSMVKVNYEGKTIDGKVGLRLWFTCQQVLFGRFTFLSSWLMVSASRGRSSHSLY